MGRHLIYQQALRGSKPTRQGGSLIGPSCLLSHGGATSAYGGKKMVKVKTRQKRMRSGGEKNDEREIEWTWLEIEGAFKDLLGAHFARVYPVCRDPNRSHFTIVVYWHRLTKAHGQPKQRSKLLKFPKDDFVEVCVVVLMVLPGVCNGKARNKERERNVWTNSEAISQEKSVPLNDISRTGFWRSQERKVDSNFDYMDFRRRVGRRRDYISSVLNYEIVKNSLVSYVGRRIRIMHYEEEFSLSIERNRQFLGSGGSPSATCSAEDCVLGWLKVLEELEKCRSSVSFRDPHHGVVVAGEGLFQASPRHLTPWVNLSFNTNVIPSLSSKVCRLLLFRVGLEPL
eukprot:Gb_15380 [translate_table: standard]